MKLCVGKITKKEKPIFSFRVGIWEASKWLLSNVSLEQALLDKAYTAAGVDPKSDMHDAELSFFGEPANQYEVKLMVYAWEDAK